MKQSHLAAIALLAAGLLTGCTEDRLLQDNTKTEEYVRQFIEDFGIPAEGHDFSMATSAGLQIKSSRSERIIVTAEIDGEEYEFANLTVNPGINPLPVIIPSNVNTLNVYVGFDKYTVGANQTFDLDNPGNPVASRGYGWDSSDRSFSVNTDGNPVIAFKYGDFLKDYFNKYPEGNDNTSMKDQRKEWDYYGLYQYYGDETYLDKKTNTEKKLNFFYCETAFGDTKKSLSDDETLISFDIFPVYWRTSEDGKNYGFRFTDAVNPNNHIPVDFGSTANIPFPKLGYSTTVSSVDKIDFKNLSKDFTFDTGTFNKAYQDPADNMMIVSEGITVTIPKNDISALFNLDVLTYLNGSTTDYTVSSSGPYLNSRYWGDNYFQTKLSDLVTCVGSTKRTMLDKHLLAGVAYNKNTAVSARAYTLSIYNPGDNQVEYRNKGVLPFLLGFNTPAKSPDDATTKRDYANVVFLVVPRSETSVFGRITTKSFKKYYWTIAAEDLGGSFDWDFNDAVFSFWEVIEDLNTVNNYYERTILWGPKDAVPVRTINIWANAAGGTMPLYVTYTGRVYASGDINLPSSNTKYTYSYFNDQILKKFQDDKVLDGTWVVGTEIHTWLARSTYTEMFNTGATREVISDTPWDSKTPNHKALAPVQIRVPIDATPAQYNYNNPTQGPSMSSTNLPLLGFAVLVDKNNKLEIMTDNGYGNGYGIAPLSGYTLGEDTYLIGRPDFSKNDIAPRLLLVPGGMCEDNEAIISAQKSEWEWPRERVSIKEAYPDFEKWVANPNFDWTKNKVDSKVTKKN